MTQPSRILVSGSTGFIGSALVTTLRSQGHHVTRLVRSAGRASDDTVVWSPQTGTVNSGIMEGFDAVVHLAAESIAARRWTEKEKQIILDSRAHSTRLLCERLAQLAAPPKVIVSASAMGYYGERGDELLTEKASPGDGFLCDVVRAWEEATLPAVEAGIRVVNLRFGIVLSPQGGTLKELLPLFRIGLGGTMAGGEQFFSWITMQDAIGVIMHSISEEMLRGPVNAASPNAVRQWEFAHVLGRVMGRPSVVNVPRWVLRLRLGRELADFVLGSARLVPEKLAASGYHFLYPELEAGLRSLLSKQASK
jgi:uncharacterized protein (TIGR01777 family)